ncbi:sigma-70 family RNA polymerase sigma factor [Pedobacter rhizosphaerae]|uniref:RNA polymerase sigma-70 factor, ECF subfamily n=1 Tax=Pedobacter rhizosphaerae TaxID=390241 RepID=A0A1H9VKW1_9SPHI|nr:sigma-70 family RNA polymerase sigma factor [Pedobacter rhizosphaerae]SES22232.1 RNA polymerase sigma-70 factor, ECF subfamily [Pedobacter rhizosphaerae]
MHLTLNFNTEIYKYRAPLYEKAVFYTRDEATAADLVQDTFVKAFRFADSFQLGSNVRAWLFTILKNTFYNDYRRDQKRAAVITADDEVSNAQLHHSAHENRGSAKFIMEDIQRALLCVPEESRYCFCRYFEGYKYHEIAEELNLPLGTVKTRIHVARELLKKQLKAYRSR